MTMRGMSKKEYDKLGKDRDAKMDKFIAKSDKRRKDKQQKDYDRVEARHAKEDAKALSRSLRRQQKKQGR